MELSNKLLSQLTAHTYTSTPLLFNMSAKWYPEGYSYPTLPPNFGGSPATSSSGNSSGHRPSLSKPTVPARDGAAGRVGYHDRSMKSTSCHTSVLGHPPLDSTAGRPELVAGVDYFKVRFLGLSGDLQINSLSIDRRDCSDSSLPYRQERLQQLAAWKGRPPHL